MPEDKPEQGTPMESSVDLHGFLGMLKVMVGEFCLPKGTPLYLQEVETEDESCFSLHEMDDDSTGVVFKFYKGILLPKDAST